MFEKLYLKLRKKKCSDKSPHTLCSHFPSDKWSKTTEAKKIKIEGCFEKYQFKEEEREPSGNKIKNSIRVAHVHFHYK